MNNFGHIFRLAIFGESHGPAVGVVVDGVPAGLPLEPEDFMADLRRRWPQKIGVSSRREPDRPEIKSGLYRGKTTGAALMILFSNQTQKSSDYLALENLPRPGHADFAAWHRFGGFNDPRGGGPFSGRLTVGLVAAGVVAKRIIAPIKVEAWLSEAGGSEDIETAVAEAWKAKDSVGGLVICRAKPMPVGLGEPFFDSVESLLAHLIFSIPGIKGIEFGRGFELSRMKGSEANDIIIDRRGRTMTNNNGGVTGGLTNGNELYLRVAAKPTPSIGRPQPTVDLRTGEKKVIEIKGQHDVCLALRLPVIVEAAVACVLADLLLRAQKVPLVWGENREKAGWEEEASNKRARTKNKKREKNGA